MNTTKQYLNDYFKKSNDQVKASVSQSLEEIIELSKEMADVMVKDGVIQLFGIEADHALSMELGFRAGGLIQYHIMDINDLALRNVISVEESLKEDFLYQEGLANKLYDLYNIHDADAFLIYVSHEIYPVVRDLAKLAKEKGHPVYLITSKKAILDFDEELSNEVMEIADRVLDIKIDHPDTFFDFEGYKLTQISNLITNIFAQSITMEIYKYLKSIDEEPQVLWSMNVEGADEHNKDLVSKYDGRWNS